MDVEKVVEEAKELSNKIFDCLLGKPGFVSAVAMQHVLGYLIAQHGEEGIEERYESVCRNIKINMKEAIQFFKENPCTCGGEDEGK